MTKNSLRVYLCGPMSDLPQHNFPAFERAAQDLRSRGYDVISPHELDDEIEREAAWSSADGATHADLWAECLARDIKLIATDGIEAMVTLEDWERSRGAALETFVAYRLCDLPVYAYGPSDPLEEITRLHLDIVHTS